MNIAHKLCVPHLTELEPYQSARRLGGSGEVWLNANELPYGWDEYRVDSSVYHRYPDARSDALVDAYSSYTGVARERVLATRGADEGIELLIRAFCAPGSDRIATTPPTYGMYEVSANIHGVAIAEVARGPDFAIDIDALRALEAVKLIFVCSPNNPTGTLTEREEMVALLEAFEERALVVVDEAYIEFCFEEGQQALLAHHPNLVILRTLSKAFGLAAVRCGFVLADPGVIGVLSNIIAPYPIPTPVEQIALQALSSAGIARMRERVREITRRRDQILPRLAQLPGVVRVPGSCANFLLVEFADAERAVRLLQEAGVVARAPYTQGLIGNCQRITIGTEEEMARVIAALEQLAD